MAIQHILVPSDFSDSAKRALGHAFAVAKLHQARITILHVVTVFDDDPYNPEKSFPDVGEYYNHLEKRAGDHFKSALSSTPTTDIPVDTVIQRGFSPHEEILTYAAHHNVDFIAMGTHGRKPLARFFMGSVAEKVVHHAECPVLTVRFSEESSLTKIPSYERILVPTDFSEQSRNAIELAVHLLPESGTVDLLHVVEDSIHPSYFATDGDTLLDVLPNIREKSNELLQNFATDLIPDRLQTHLVIQEGRISQTILDYAEENPVDVIAMGTHGLNVLSQIFIGSQTNRVLRKAACPVITIK